MQRHFDADLAELRHVLVTMGALVESMLGQAVRLLTEHDEAVAQQLYQDEAEVNRLHLQIDDICLRLLALRQPAAADLRLIASALKMNSDLERIGDQAINLLKRAQTLDRQEGEWPTIDLSPLVRTASSMVADALDAFIRKDVALARKVLEDEKTADQLRHEIESVLIGQAEKKTHNIGQAEKKTHNFLQLLQLILVTHHLERIADHATNIAEDVIYFLEGRDVRHHHA